jgi:hypothetical protein
MDLSLLDEVRIKCRKVAEEAVLVRFDPAALAGYAASLPTERLLLPEMDPATHYLGQGRDTLAYYLTLDAINFGSGYFPDIFGYRQSGYRTVAAALTKHFRDFGPIPPEELRKVSPQDFAGILGLDAANPVVSQLMAGYASSLNDLGAYLCNSFQSDFSRLVAEAGNSAERLVEILAKMPLYRDVALYGEITVPFYKRAQLTAVDLFIAFEGIGPGRFDDIERLTICADNLVPHVLRLDGVLRYRQDLADRIDRGEPLAAGSTEEVEIRACSVHVSELIVAELQGGGAKINAMMLDNLLWHRGQQPFYRDRPRHRTRTAFY